ncbi:unnamed protein product [Amoebophrya sp. A25]|nr:unnamed protein product [Amoebophrya sp. A25]|eukprot:GSA25T00003265001.1
MLKATVRLIYPLIYLLLTTSIAKKQDLVRYKQSSCRHEENSKLNFISNYPNPSITNFMFIILPSCCQPLGLCWTQAPTYSGIVVFTYLYYRCGSRYSVHI